MSKRSETAKVVARWSAAVLILVFLVVGLVSNWSSLRRENVSLHWPQLALAVFFNTVFLLSQALIWRTFVTQLGSELRFATGASIWVNSQLSKYVPGKVMVLLVRVVYGERVGVPKTTTLLTIYLELVLMVVTGTGLFLILTGPWMTHLSGLHLHPAIPWVIVASGLIGLHPRILNPLVNFGLTLIKQPPVSISTRYSTIIGLAAVAVVGWFFHGLAGVACVRSVGIEPAASLGLHTGFFALAWVLGFLSFLTPGGIGVREGVLAFALATIYPKEVAVAVSLISRLAWVAAEIVLAGVFFKFTPRPAHRDADRPQKNTRSDDSEP